MATKLKGKRDCPVCGKEGLENPGPHVSAMIRQGKKKKAHKRLLKMSKESGSWDEAFNEYEGRTATANAVATASAVDVDPAEEIAALQAILANPVVSAALRVSASERLDVLRAAVAQAAASAAAPATPATGGQAPRSQGLTPEQLEAQAKAKVQITPDGLTLWECMAIVALQWLARKTFKGSNKRAEEKAWLESTPMGSGPLAGWPHGTGREGAVWRQWPLHAMIIGRLNKSIAEAWRKALIRRLLKVHRSEAKIASLLTAAAIMKVPVDADQWLSRKVSALTLQITAHDESAGRGEAVTTDPHQPPPGASLASLLGL